jgi:hypothetical protein
MVSLPKFFLFSSLATILFFNVLRFHLKNVSLIINAVEKTMKNLLKKMQLQQKIQEKTPEDIDRYSDSLKKLFKDYKVDIDDNKAFFDALVDWKRTL